MNLQSSYHSATLCKMNRPISRDLCVVQHRLLKGLLNCRPSEVPGKVHLRTIDAQLIKTAKSWGKTYNNNNNKKKKKKKKNNNNNNNTHYETMALCFNSSLLSFTPFIAKGSTLTSSAAKLMSSLGAHGGKVEHSIRRAAIGRFVEVSESQFQIASLESASNLPTVPLVSLGWARGFDEKI